MTRPAAHDSRLDCPIAYRIFRRQNFTVVPIYDIGAITSFKDNDAGKIFNGLRSRKLKRWPKPSTANWPSCTQPARFGTSKAPGLQLEDLKGDRAGRHSIRINDQYRICFVWQDGKAAGVEIDDYH